jgi:DNA invertase Pin-like site-specific DNA recombinase
MSVIAYERVSKEDQNLELQRFGLMKAGYDRLFEDDGVSAVAERREGFEAAIAALQPGDTLLVWKNDRAFRSIEDAVLTMKRFRSLGITFRSLTEHIDTATAFGRSMFYMINVFSELERELICERTRAGLDVARRSGKRLGRRHKLTSEDVVWAREQLADIYTMKQVAEVLLVCPRTLKRALSGD